MQPTNNGSEAQNAPVADSEPMTRTDFHDAFLGELQQHKAILFKVANAYCSRREDRGDLIQDITIELFTAYPKFDGRVARFSTWMYRIAMNVAISAHRGDNRRIRDALSIDEFGMDLAAADRELASGDDDLHALHQMIATLEPINRALILLYLEGYGQEEIAEMIGLTATNVATRIGRIKQQLQRDHAATEKSS
jgi:RNA polymerase sigma factor (sigma-70 family)